MTKKCLILTSGGDAPGMNAAIRAVVRSGLHNGFEMFGCELGFQGIIDQKLFPLSVESVANCLQRGGTILKTARCEAFKDPAVQAQCGAYLQQQGIDAIIILGGNGSFQGGFKLSESRNLQVIGIPCTIDNDIVGTDFCIGFDTACNTALSAIDKIRDTALSHDRNFIIEVMGRSSGFLAVEVGLAGGAEFILIPEAPVSIDQLVNKIQSKKRQKLTSIIVAAEADQPGHTNALAQTLFERTEITYKTCVLGHIQRGGSPTARDRVLATLMGQKAIEGIKQDQTHKMVANINNHYYLVDLPSPENATRHFDHHDLLNINHIVSGIS